MNFSIFCTAFLEPAQKNILFLMANEKTLSIIKPDISKISVAWEIISVLEKKGLRIAEMKITLIAPREATIFYQEHKAKPFFKEMIKFMCSSPVVIMCLEGENAIRINREIMGATNPQEAEPGTIRKIYGKSIDNNAIHGSDSPQAAEREINLFFGRRVFRRNPRSKLFSKTTNQKKELK